MSCSDCEKVQDLKDVTSYYRWDYANIEIKACKKHLQEVFEALDRVQRERLKR